MTTDGCLHARVVPATHRTAYRLDSAHQVVDSNGHIPKDLGVVPARVTPLVGWPNALVNDRSWIAQLELQPHPEGGWYREIHRSTQAISRSDGEARSALTAILFLLHADEFSSWHRVTDQSRLAGGSGRFKAASLAP